MGLSIFFEEVGSEPASSNELDDIQNTSPSASTPSPSPPTGESASILRIDLIEQARLGPLADTNDLDIASELLELVHTELENYATNGSQILTDAQMTKTILAFRAILRRMGISLELPFRNFSTFRTYWIENGMDGTGGRNKRRRCLESLLQGPREEIDALTEGRLTKPLANPVIGSKLMWPDVDIEIAELRRKYESAATPQDYRALGTNCIGVLEAIGDVIFVPERHLRPGDNASEFVRDKFKNRLDRYVEVEMMNEKEELRKMVKATNALVHKVKHELGSTLMAGIAADSTILIASMFRRMADPTFERTLNDEIPF